MVVDYQDDRCAEQQGAPRDQRRHHGAVFLVVPFAGKPHHRFLPRRRHVQDRYPRDAVSDEAGRAVEALLWARVPVSAEQSVVNPDVATGEADWHDKCPVEPARPLKLRVRGVYAHMRRVYGGRRRSNGEKARFPACYVTIIAIVVLTELHRAQNPLQVPLHGVVCAHMAQRLDQYLYRCVAIHSDFLHYSPRAEAVRPVERPVSLVVDGQGGYVAVVEAKVLFFHFVGLNG